MRIDQLTLKNFRCFEHFELALHSNLTVLVAANGGGKTAVLDGLAVALRYFVDTMLGRATSKGFERTDVRQIRGLFGEMLGVVPTEFTAHGVVAGRRTTWSRALASEGGRTTSAAASELASAARQLVADYKTHLSDPERPAPALPVVAYYGTARLWNQARITSGRKRLATGLANPLHAYDECLTPSSYFGHLSLWFEAMSRELAQATQRGTPSPHRPAERLAAVLEATNRVLEPVGWRDLQYDHVRRELAAEHPQQGRLPVALLSDGVRNVIALIADLAHRCVRLNPSLGSAAPAKTEGVVLIDELDMHLHPGWQQQVVGALRSAFPRVQFVLTTHSPQLITTVPRECLRLLSEDTVTIPPLQTQGDDSATILARVMGVDPVPPVEHADRLSHYRALVERGVHDTSEGRQLLEGLVSHFGEDHPLIEDLGRLRRWQGVKSRLAHRKD